jgi:hypothetical protein
MRIIKSSLRMFEAALFIFSCSKSFSLKYEP